MKNVFLGIAAVLMLVACVETTAVSVQPVRLSSSQLALVKGQVVENFKDPGSAQFRRIVTYRVANGDTATCGEVNGKNSFGAYVGFKQFYVRSNGQTVKRSYVDQDSSFGLARTACNQAAQGQGLAGLVAFQVREVQRGRAQRDEGCGPSGFGGNGPSMTYNRYQPNGHGQ